MTLHIMIASLQLMAFSIVSSDPGLKVWYKQATQKDLGWVVD